MLHTDFHTHTTFCDGKSTPREMVEAAYRMGMTDLGVSGHADFSMFEPGFGMDDEKLRQYTEELQELREEYRGKMNLYIGIELDGLGPVQKAEYAIGSTHALIKDGEYVCVDDTEEKLVKAVETLWHGDWYAFAREYFEAEAQIYDRTKCDFIGHFDLLTKLMRDINILMRRKTPIWNRRSRRCTNWRLWGFRLRSTQAPCPAATGVRRTRPQPC